MLNRRTWLFAATALSVAVVALVVLESESPSPTAPTTNSSAQHEPLTPTTPTVDVDDADRGSRAGAEASAALDDPTESDAAFRADASGELVLDEQTRLNIEALIAHSEPRELHAAVREQTEELPPAAARRAEELVEKFVHYQQAQRQTYPPDEAPLTADDAIRQLEGLHALREAYFGAEAARRFFGKEEVIGREMIEVMRVENDQSLTTEEKLVRAQALREQLPGVAAIEKSNRESAAVETQDQREKK